MKKIFLMFICLLVLTGCTVEIEKEDNKDEKEVKVSIDESTEVKINGKTSKKDSPLSIGEIGRCSKYNELNDSYKDIDIKLIEKVNDQKLIDDYNKKNPDNKLEKKTGFNIVLFKYEVYFTDYETESFGSDSVVDVEITNSSDESFVVDKVKQIINVYNIEKTNGIVDGEKGTGVIGFNIPSGTKNYLIKFGTLKHTIAYYKIG